MGQRTKDIGEFIGAGVIGALGGHMAGKNADLRTSVIRKEGQPVKAWADTRAWLAALGLGGLAFGVKGMMRSAAKALANGAGVSFLSTEAARAAAVERAKGGTTTVVVQGDDDEDVIVEGDDDDVIVED